MRTKLFIGSASAVVLVVAAVAFAGVFTEPQPTITQQGYICPVTGEELPCPLCCPYKAQAAKPSAQPQSCGTEQDCCPECLACCAEDGCCWKCILCCIAMGCDPAGCVSSSTSAKAEACGTKPAVKTAKACCGDGCCK
jgi:hypothetical protein